MSRLCCDRRMLSLLPLFFSIGFSVPYQTNTFGGRFFDASALGLETILFFVAGMLGGVASGAMLDRQPSPRRHFSRRHRQERCKL